MRSQYFMVVQYLHKLQCPACGGSGAKLVQGSTVAKDCRFCKGSGFRDGAAHFLISGQQVRVVVPG